jgi:beta-glucosidase-like glycosyl hydrolase
MNMGGVRNVPNNNTKAIAAGCDILLMPADARKAHGELMMAYDSNDMKETIDASVKRIIRMKICLGLL